MRRFSFFGGTTLASIIIMNVLQAAEIALDATVNATIAVDIKQNGTHSLFQRTDKGVYALRDCGLPEFHAPDEPADVEDDTQQTTLDVSTTKSFSFTDAAEQVLKQFSGSKPMHYREITTSHIIRVD